MDPLSLGIGAIGIGMQLFGGISAMGKANQANAIQNQITSTENQVNQQKEQQMELSARRQQTEIYRNTQRARSMALTSATNQGAQFGSGLQGGLAQVSGQGAYNSLGVSNNLQIGRNIFSLDSQISADKMQLSNVQTSMSNDQGIASLGGMVTKNAGTMASLGQNAGSFLSGNNTILNGTSFNPLQGMFG